MKITSVNHASIEFGAHIRKHICWRDEWNHLVQAAELQKDTGEVIHLQTIGGVWSIGANDEALKHLKNANICSTKQDINRYRS